MDSPKAQGVTGFLRRAGGRFELSELTIAIQNEYATLNVVSLDDLPIARSSRVLVQVVTVNRLTGRETRDATLKIGKGERAYEVAGEQIVRIGKPPFRIANSKVEIEFKSARFKAARSWISTVTQLLARPSATRSSPRRRMQSTLCWRPVPRTRIHARHPPSLQRSPGSADWPHRPPSPDRVWSPQTAAARTPCDGRKCGECPAPRRHHAATDQRERRS